jgi:ubiquinone biosynthesis protein
MRFSNTSRRLGALETAMIYSLMRLLVNTLAVFLTIWLLPGLWPNPALSYVFYESAIAYVFMGFIVCLCNWLLWPVILFFTGRLVLAIYAPFFVAVNAFLFYLATLGLISGQGQRGESLPLILTYRPTWLWIALGGLLLTIFLFMLEGLTGLDSPARYRDRTRRTYWRILNRLAIDDRAPFVENLRIAQSLSIISRYARDIAFDATPFSPIRRFFQRTIYRKKYQPLIDESAAATIRLMLQELGPTFVKLGQIISSRAEQLPQEWRKELAQLQSQVEAFPSHEAKQIITEELGQPPEQLFACFEDVSFAAASTAQVHKVELFNGQTAVVKVQRPDIDVTVRADLNVMRDVARLLERRFVWAKQSDLQGIMREYAEGILLELDYTNEAFNGRLLAENMRLLPAIQVPTIYTELSSARVMTQEFVKGVKITNIQALNAAGCNCPDLAVTFTRAMIKQVLFDGFFHGDPHPGNVLVDTESSRIIFLDMGMMGSLTSSKRMALADLIWSLAERDTRELGRVMLRLTTRFKEVDEEAFLEDVDRLLKRYTSLSDSGISLAGAMTAMFDAMYLAGLRLDAELTLALKALVQAEEIVSTLDPNLALVDAAFTAAKELLVETFDPDAVMTSIRRQLLRSAKEAVRSIPSIEEAVGGWLREFRRGRFTVYVDASDASRQIHELDASLTMNMKRLTLALLLVGLVIGASIASTVQSTVLPNLAELAYFIFLAGVIIAGGIILRTVWSWVNTGEF